MEGILLVPPDRGTILGRAVWKPRYVVIGPLSQKDGYQPNLSLSQVLSTARIRDVSGWSSKSQQKAPTDTIYLSVYKSKEGSDLVHQHSIASITECQVQHLAHRKQGHVLPTLAVQISPDPATDKLRKRRSSRTGGLTATKDSGPTTLWFRTAEESRYGLGDWARYIQMLIQPEVPGRHSMPMSPISPVSPAFVNPFTSKQDATEKPSSASGPKGKLRSKLQSKSSGHAHPSTRDPSSTYTSETPSLRSRNSDISSHASSMLPAAMNFVQKHYPNLQQSDLPSPASTVGDYPEQFIEGWTTAQGRSSALSSPIRGRASTSSSQAPNQPGLDSNSSPAPRETILDRAFQLRCIPGSDRDIPGEEKLTSLAKFEALMREEEDRQKTGEGGVPGPAKSTWDDDESDDDDFNEDEEDDDSDEYAFEHDVDHDGMNTSTSRALQFIINRHGSTHGSRASHYSESGGLSNGPSILRPHTAHSRIRPIAQRTNSQPYIPGLPLHIPSSPPPKPIEEIALRRSHEKRHSTSDVKNLGFNEFAKRLSGTSSLLLVQTNTSTGSNRGSGDYDGTQQTTPRAPLSPLATSSTPSERDEHCRWRGSIGVFGNEGGFL
ncbi:hypothetical protein F5Y19DRAFT_467273 [Xylariaceae sp. FL1651]|nr:hypothetical protein F5Y19DRAFT_467273 [Xylariaceae sp. FL1651]